MLLTAQSLSKRYGDVVAVDGVSFELDRGETLALIGASGCGKTTTLKLLNRLIEPDTGEVRLAGDGAHAVDAHEWRRRIGYVVQSAGLFPHWSVARNIAATCALLEWDEGRTQAQVGRLMDMIGLPAADYAERKPAELSGGQRQRVGLARALAAEPDLILMDEPFSAVDALTKESLITDVSRLRSEIGFAAVIVTHDFAEALAFADRIAVMDAGKIVQIGTADELVRSPSDPAVEALIDAPRRTAARVADALGAG
ncbi:MAG: ATP-binding cassette domain-containing protein [Pseudomonadota bacterium]